MRTIFDPSCWRESRIIEVVPQQSRTHGNRLETEVDYDLAYRITDIDFADLDALTSLTYQ